MITIVPLSNSSCFFIYDYFSLITFTITLLYIPFLPSVHKKLYLYQHILHLCKIHTVSSNNRARIKTGGFLYERRRGFLYERRRGFLYERRRGFLYERRRGFLYERRRGYLYERRRGCLYRTAYAERSVSFCVIVRSGNRPGSS